MSAVWRRCHCYFRSPKSLVLFLSVSISWRFLLHLVSSPHSPCISGSIPSKQSHTTHSGGWFACLSSPVVSCAVKILSFVECMWNARRHLGRGVAVGPCDAALEKLGGLTAKPRACLQIGCIMPSVWVLSPCVHCCLTVWRILISYHSYSTQIKVLHIVCMHILTSCNKQQQCVY